MKLIYTGDYELHIKKNIDRLNSVIEDLQKSAKNCVGNSLGEVYIDLAEHLSDKLDAYKEKYEKANRRNDIVYSQIDILKPLDRFKMEILERALIHRHLEFYVWCSMGDTGLIRVEYSYNVSIKMH